MSQNLDVLIKTIKLLVCFILFPLLIWGQNNIVAGYVLDKTTSKPIPDVKIIFDNKDSLLSSNQLGYFELNYPKDLQPISIVFHHINYEEQSLNISQSYKNLEVVLIYMTPTIKKDSSQNESECQKKYFYDTSLQKIVFCTDSLQLNNFFVIKDLLKNLPFLFKSDDKYQAYGNDLDELTIDNKSFYIANTIAILKNTPSTFIEKIELDENNLNLVTKNEYKNSIFGQVYAGISNLGRWNTGGNLNLFNGDQVFSIVHNSNNCNIQNFSKLNLSNLESNSNILQSGSRFNNDIRSQYNSFFGSIKDFVIDQSNGINESVVFGTSYFNIYKKWIFNGNYFFDKTDNETEAEYKRIFYQKSDSLTYLEKSKSESSNLNHRLNIKTTYNADSLQNITIEATLLMQEINGQSQIQGEYHSSLFKLSEASNTNSLKSDIIHFSIPLTYNKTFRSNKQRTISAILTPEFSSEKRPGSLYSEYSLHLGPRLPSSHYALELDNLLKRNKNSISSEFIYTEPINSTSEVIFEWNGLFEFSNYEIKNQKFNNSNPVLTDSMISIQIDRKHINNNFGLYYHYKNSRLEIKPGLNFQILDYSLDKNYPISNRSNFPINNFFLPEIYLRYKFTPYHLIYFEYSQSTITPTMYQTKDVLIINNILNLERGNPLLTPTVSNDIEIRYNWFNSKKPIFLEYKFTVSFAKDYIGSVLFDVDSLLSLRGSTKGIKLINYQNFKGYYALNSFIHYNQAIPSIYCNLDIYIQNIYSNIPSNYNNTTFFSKESINKLGVSLKSKINHNIHMSLDSESIFYNISNTLPSKTSTKYLTQQFQFSLFYNFFKSLFISTDILNNNYFALSKNYENTHFIVVNASVGYRFLQDRSMDIKFSVNDLFNQNTNIQYTFTDNYSEMLKTNNLKRYFLLTLTYYLKETKVFNN